MGYHDNAIYPYVELDTGIDDTASKQKLEDLISNINPLGVTVDPNELVGDSSLINGGVMGRLLRLVRVHLEEAKDKNELSEEVSGEVYGKLMEASLAGAIEFLFKNEQLKISDREASAKLIHALQESRSFDLDFEKSQIERQKVQFEVNHLMPLQREEMVENIEFLHLKHLGAKIENDSGLFNLTSILPKESDRLTLSNTNLGKSGVLLDDDHDLRDLDKTSRDFTNTQILPKESLKLTKNNTILDDNHDILVLDKANKGFINTSIQPKESALLTDRHDLNTLEKANKSFINTNIQPKEKILLDDKHDINVLEKSNKSFINTSIQPKESSLLDDRHDLNTLDKANKSFLNTNIQPRESILLNDKHDSNVLENEIRDYYKDFIQSEEKLTMIANRKIAEEKILVSKQQVLLGAKDIELKTKQVTMAGKDIELKTKQIVLDEKKITLAEKEIDVKEKQILLDEKRILISEKELDIKSYELATILPANVAKINAEISMIGAQTCIANSDCQIKQYYRTDIQPSERDLSVGKARTAMILAGMTDGSYVDGNSMARKQIEQMAAQTGLYIKQEASYDDKKELDLLKIQANYASMIFSDLENPAQYTLAFGDNTSTSATYDRLVPVP